jgi:hypothetical protein
MGRGNPQRARGNAEYKGGNQQSSRGTVGTPAEARGSRAWEWLRENRPFRATMGYWGTGQGRDFRRRQQQMRLRLQRLRCERRCLAPGRKPLLSA